MNMQQMKRVLNRERQRRVHRMHVSGHELKRQNVSIAGRTKSDVRRTAAQTQTNRRSGSYQ